VSGFVNDHIRRGRRKVEFSAGRRVQLFIRGMWMIGLGVAGLWAAWMLR
jgi:hypothetical protein